MAANPSEKEAPPQQDENGYPIIASPDPPTTSAPAAGGAAAPADPNLPMEPMDKERQLIVRAGVRRFNANQKQGMEFLVAHGLLEHDPGCVAHFLLTTPGISKVALGEYFGKDVPFNKDVVRRAIDSLTLRGQEFLPALRAFLTLFRLPGEAQQIDRLINVFCNTYHTENPGKFETADEAYILSFSCIMLSTDISRVPPQNRMTFDQFSRQMRGSAAGGKDFRPEFVQQLYDGIRQHNLDTHFPMARILHRGWMRIPGWWLMPWSRKWFAVSDACLYMYDAEADANWKVMIELDGLAVRRVKDGKPNSFELFPTAGPNLTVIRPNERQGGTVREEVATYVLQAESEQELEEWLAQLRVGALTDEDLAFEKSLLR